MNFNVACGSLTDIKSDAVIVNLFEGVKTPGGGTGAVDKALDGAISDLIRDEDFEGHLGDTLVLRTLGRIPAKTVIVVGLGKKSDFDMLKLMRASARAARKCREIRAKTVSSILHGAGIGGFQAKDCARSTILGAMLGSYEYTSLKTENVKGNTIERFDIVEMSADKLSDIRAGIDKAKIVGDAIIFARDLVNAPSNIVTPSYLAEIAEQIADESGLECNILDRAEIEAAGMGLLAAVARGSEVEPRFIELKYTSTNAKKTVAIVGKGITFDTGGYNLKGGEHMYGMKDDMSGAAAVLAAMRAVGREKPDVNVVGVIPATENMIGGRAIHPGDVFKSYSGKSVEVNNTDAEGRLILADAVAYAKSLGVDEIVDAATLTGGCGVALGRELSGIFGTNDELVARLMRAGKSCGEGMWRLPLYDSYEEFLKSDVADLKNSGPREGSPINGALFIKSFVGDTAWAHIDLSSAMADKDVDLSKKGGTGAATGTLVEYLLGCYCLDTHPGD
ncbi:MAG: leucyl aminopeptidase [Armatimonadota bacterium]|nr:leucyl aminopeptidase [bacterium]